MPYASKKKQKQAMREMYSAKYRASRKFREAEKVRKAAWYQANREKVIAKVLAAREGK